MKVPLEIQSCRYGTILYLPHDGYVGQSLSKYGEFSESEVELWRQVIPKNATVLDIGANIGAHTLAFADIVGPHGQVVAFEPQPFLYDLICLSLACNENAQKVATTWQVGLGNETRSVDFPIIDYSVPNNFGGLELKNYGVSLDRTYKVRIETLDSYGLDRCNFIKIDVEGMELEVLQGASQTINKYRPILYLEADQPDKAPTVIKHLEDLGYKIYWHIANLYNPNNFLHNSVNCFPGIGSINVFCVPAETPQTVQLMPCTSETVGKHLLPGDNGVKSKFVYA